MVQIKICLLEGILLKLCIISISTQGCQYITVLQIIPSVNQSCVDIKFSCIELYIYFFLNNTLNDAVTDLSMFSAHQVTLESPPESQLNAQ